MWTLTEIVFAYSIYSLVEHCITMEAHSRQCDGKKKIWENFSLFWDTDSLFREFLIMTWRIFFFSSHWQKWASIFNCILLIKNIIWNVKCLYVGDHVVCSRQISLFIGRVDGHLFERGLGAERTLRMLWASPSKADLRLALSTPFSGFKLGRLPFLSIFILLHTHTHTHTHTQKHTKSLLSAVYWVLIISQVHYCSHYTVSLCLIKIISITQLYSLHPAEETQSSEKDEQTWYIIIL